MQARLIALACTRPSMTPEGLRRDRWTHRELTEQVGMQESQAHELSILARRLLKRGAFSSTTDLAHQMLAFVETYNQTARPFQWTYTGKVLTA